MKHAVTQFHSDSRTITADLEHRDRIRTAMGKYEVTRRHTQGVFQDWQRARQTAAETKWQALNHLDEHLVEFEKQATARGTQVHWARNAAEAREIILRLIKDAGARRIVKSKVMTSEEIHLNDALEQAGYHVLESDLGEFIQQLQHQAPYHFVFPCMHLSRQEINELFQDKLKSANTNDPEELTMIARQWLRDKYLQADVGITGANFIVAETGMISITENEGNARLTGALPKMMISLVGIEKVVPRLADLALFLPMLATAGTGQALTGYNTMYAGPRQPGEMDGPEAFHIVLLDNHRTALLADPEQRDALHCIRCGACLNVCPVFKNIGGLSYGTTYQGPIGSVITPHLRGLQDWQHLSGASSLCGACTQTCPVKIDLHHHLLQNRRNAVHPAVAGVVAPSAGVAIPKPVSQSRSPHWGELVSWTLFAQAMVRPWLYQLGTRLAARCQPLGRWLGKIPGTPLHAWTVSRELPVLPQQSFRDWWQTRRD